MEQEVIVLTEEQIRFIYEVLNKPYIVRATMTIYTECRPDDCTMIDISLDNDTSKFKWINLVYNLDNQCETVVLDQRYTNESYEELVQLLTDAFETTEFKKRVHAANTGGNFDKHKNIVFKTYKSA